LNIELLVLCGRGVVVSPPAGYKWKDVRHDNTVTWLASWTENVQNQTKYVMLNAASKLKVGFVCSIVETRV
jgi:DNA topoisomerase-1